MRWLALLAVPFLLAAAPVPLAGTYALSGVMEAAGGLELRADGTFSYGMTYGALDEWAEGRWRQEGDRVLLTTSPAPRAPEFRIILAEPGDPKLFQLMLEGMDGRPVSNIEVAVTMADGRVEKINTRNDWLEADLDGKHVPVSIQFHIPVFEVDSQPLPVDVAVARRYRVRLDPADLGVRNFQDWPLEIRGDLLAPPDAPGRQGFRRTDAGD